MEVTPETKLGERVLKIATDIAVAELINNNRDVIIDRVRELLVDPKKLMEGHGGATAE